MKKRSNRAPRRRPTADDEWELTPAQERELLRRIRDGRDRTRYLLASRLLRELDLFYDITNDVYVWRDPTGATLFKRRAAAERIRPLLGKHIEVVRCRVDAKGRLVKSSVPLRRRTRSTVAPAGESRKRPRARRRRRTE